MVAALTADLGVVVLFSVAGLYALYEAYHKWCDPHPIKGSWWWVPLAVLVGAIALEGRSFWVATHESLKTKVRQSWSRFNRTAKGPGLPVILIDDFAALIGLALALSGVGLTLLTGNGHWDAAGTACIGVLVVVVAMVPAVGTESLLLGESGFPENVRALRRRALTPALYPSRGRGGRRCRPARGALGSLSGGRLRW